MSLELKNNPTLKDFQQYVLQMKRERGFCSGQNGFAKLAKWFCIAFKV